MRLAERLGLHRRELVAWALYDCANSALWTTVIAAVFPVFFTRHAAADLPAAQADVHYLKTTTICLTVAALLAPLLGAVADVSGARKKWLTGFMLLGVGATAAMFWIERGAWIYAAIVFALANLGATSSMVFYDALLPHVAREHEVDRVSSAGFAVGYLGGGLLLAVDLVLIQKPEWFGLQSGPGLDPERASLPTRIAFLTVAAWWLAFTLPLLRFVPEPPGAGVRGPRAIGHALRRMLASARELRRYRHALLFMLAFFAYSDGIGTIIRASALLGKNLGMTQGQLIGAYLMVQFVAVPFALVFGALAHRIGVKPLILTAIGGYALITVIASRIESASGFYAMALGVAIFQGGAQALSRSAFATLLPKHRSAEFFGLFASFEKFAGILGPLVFALVLENAGSQRAAVLSVLPFFVVGAALLACVDLRAGQRAAREAELESDGRSA